MNNCVLLCTIGMLAEMAGAKTNSTIVGTNIGGWMVLEPWITPSLFYRFLGKTRSEKVGWDSYTFCEALGPEKGNQVMKEHWDTWYTEDHIKNLSDRGVKMVRLPIGDWTLEPYGPYIGCMDGAEEKITWMLDTCEEHGIQVWLEVHAWNGSQNGFDNSGQASQVNWLNETHFEHWPTRTSEWLGHWNITTKQYDEMYPDNVKRSIKICIDLLKKWGQHYALSAFQPVNEPWEFSDLPLLKSFYTAVRRMVQVLAKPGTKFVFHDHAINMPMNATDWNDLFNDTEDIVLDHHYYQAWN